MTPRTPPPARKPRSFLRGERGEGGGTALEVVLVAPLLLLFGLLIVAGTRYAVGQQAINSAAASAARAATQQSTADQAAAIAQEQAQAALVDADITCSSVTVDIDTSGFTAPPGTTAAVVATVTCTVALGDLAVPGLPGAATLTATAASPLDIHREVLA